jgi:hypothetical protein
MFDSLKRQPLPLYEKSKPMSWNLMRLRNTHDSNMRALRRRGLVMAIVASIATLAALIPFATR